MKGPKELGMILIENPDNISTSYFNNPTGNWYILLIVRGYLEYKHNGETRKGRRGIVILPPPLGTRGINIGYDFKGYLLAIPGEYFNELEVTNGMNIYSKAISKPFSSLASNDMKIFCIYMSMIKILMNSEGQPYAAVELKHICMAFIANCRNYYSEEQDVITSSRKIRLVHQFIALASEYSISERKMSFYAKKLCVSPKYLSAVISRATGKKASQWIEEYAIAYAKGALRESDLSINDISDQMNFIATSDFCKYFRKGTGMSPREYKNKQ